ncbi:hypothetical protein D3H64_05660 [Atopobacter sp. AH10]|uniref:prolyl oligopeptidase family serine peptidase n=1 Tax=Atopobacter sp. AH10 TaxID=2315861 RepID=UPI000EF22438|nr:prolyl oligopeptidase family serine peptidase [Atopobacter sp. AH10]RLK63271.1 hypothetical protein D3H64_05660 [Atopobacter sp. AH10]
MICLTEKVLEGIPLIEAVSDHLEASTALPTIVLFHGFESRRESMMNWAVELCRLGARVIVPLAIYHGDRNQKDVTFDDLWEIVDQNTRDCEVIYSTYHRQGLIKGFAVGGQSMGGMTTVKCMLAHPFIDAGVCLMGCLDPLAYTVWVREVLATSMKTMEASELFALLEHLREASLLDHPEALRGRPFYIWHDQEDPLVPIRYSKDTFERYKTYPAFARTSYHESSGHGHHVPFSVLASASQFLAEHLNMKH